MLVLNPLGYCIYRCVHQLVKVDCVLLVIIDSEGALRRLITVGPGLLKPLLKFLHLLLLRSELIVELDVPMKYEKYGDIT